MVTHVFGSLSHHILKNMYLLLYLRSDLEEDKQQTYFL
jgi:hypothetical protein